LSEQDRTVLAAFGVNGILEVRLTTARESGLRDDGNNAVPNYGRRIPIGVPDPPAGVPRQHGDRRPDRAESGRTLRAALEKIDVTERDWQL
jgi:hypothetical protein